MINRYGFTGSHMGCQVVQDNSDGSYVRYVDHQKEVERLLNALKSCYLYHHLNSSEFGYGEISDIIHNALCNALGEDGYQSWISSIQC